MKYLFITLLLFAVNNGNGGGGIDSSSSVNASCEEVDVIVQQLVNILPQIKSFLSSYDAELMWLYPFAWAVIIVRKLFYA